MDDFPGLLTRDFGFKPQGKAAPPRNSPASADFGSNVRLGSDFVRTSPSFRGRANPATVFDDHGGDAAADGLLFNDVFGGPPKYASSESHATAFDYDDVFKDQKISKSSSMPVYDKPVFDEDIFEGIQGLKSASAASSAQYEDVLASISGSPRKPKMQDSSPFDDLLGNLGRKNAEEKMGGARDEKKDYLNFDDLITDFGRSNSPASKRSIPQLNKSQKSYSDNTKVSSNSIEDPFETLESSSNPTVSTSGIFTDPLEDIARQSGNRSKKTDQSSVQGGVSDDLDPLDSLGKSMPSINRKPMDTGPRRTESINGTQSPMKNSEHQWQSRDPGDLLGSHQSPVDLPSVSVGRSASPNEANSMTNTNSSSGGKFDSSDDAWLTVSEIPLFTQPTRAPPPSRPPPPRPTRPRRSESGSFASRNPRKTNDGFSPYENSAHSYSPTSAHPSGRTSATTQLDELEDFATGKTRSNANGYAGEFPGEDLVNSVAAAAAMKEAMEKAEAKFRHVRETRERDYFKSTRSKETVQLEKDNYLEKEPRETEERSDHERKQGLREEEEKEKRRLEKEREEREREQRRLERERLERERELARQAVQRATREARERAAAEARAKAQKAAVEKAAAEARERAEKAAVQRVQAEARERAALEAREKAEKAAAAVREKANAEAREREAREKETRVRTERAAVQRAAAEARGRAAAEAHERAVSQARANQQKDDNDLESIFNRGSRSSSSPRPRTTFKDPPFDTQNHRGHPDTARTPAGVSSSMHNASSATNIVDDLSSIFGPAASPLGEFQETGETEDRRRHRLEREQRAKDRAEKALAEKNERDLQAQREQAERHRIAETLDIEIKRWAAGKQGNLRALLSTLQYVLWPECGWQPVSLTDLMTAASVKKFYRKATLCIHPDKVQQKGASVQQKCIAEKVFDLLKEAWNKFNSEELF